MAIFSLAIEKHVLAGVIKNPSVFVDIMPFVKESDFYDLVHKTIFLLIKSLFEKGERFDKIILAEKIKNLGISFKGDINIYDYIDNLSFISITNQATVDAAKELIKIRIRRDLDSTAKEISSFVSTCGNLSTEEIIGKVDSIYGKKTDIIESANQPENLYDGIEEMIEARGNEPLEETGLKTGFPEFDRMYGGLKAGHVYAIASRPSHGKSTWLENTSIKTCRLNNTKAFICDTEMSTNEIRWRAAAAHSSVAEWYLETGNFKKNEEMAKKVKDSYPILKEFKEKQYITHYHVGDKNLDQIVSMIRRWHAKHIAPNQIGIIVYDYLKLTGGEDVSEHWKEYQVMGQKINRLKRLAEELNCVILTAIQLNRTGESHGRRSAAVLDDSTAIAMSDRLQWFAAFVAIFRRKTPDEINRDGPEFGTHKLIALKTRFQGRDAAGHQDLVRRIDEEGEVRYVYNYINFEVQNFEVTETGSLRDIIAQERGTIEVLNPNPNDGEAL